MSSVFKQCIFLRLGGVAQAGVGAVAPMAVSAMLPDEQLPCFAAVTFNEMLRIMWNKECVSKDSVCVVGLAAADPSLGGGDKPGPR